jgi:hypothetical protein
MDALLGILYSLGVKKHLNQELGVMRVRVFLVLNKSVMLTGSH